MADNVAITAGTGTTVAADELTDGTLGSCKVQFMKVMDGTLDSTNKWVIDSSGQGVTKSRGTLVTVSTDVTRPSDVLAYAANDAWSDSTSAPTTGGFTSTGAARASGGSGLITDCIVTTSNDAATLLSGEIWFFDSAVTNIND